MNTICMSLHESQVSKRGQVLSLSASHASGIAVALALPNSHLGLSMS